MPSLRRHRQKLAEQQVAFSEGERGKQITGCWTGTLLSRTSKCLFFRLSSERDSEETTCSEQAAKKQQRKKESSSGQPQEDGLFVDLSDESISLRRLVVVCMDER